MRKIDLFESIIAEFKQNGTDIDEQLERVSEDWNLSRLFRAYVNASKCESPYISFDDHFWDRDIEPMCGYLKTYGVRTFAITNTSTALMDNMREFQKRGWQVKSMEDIPVNQSKLIKNGIKVYLMKPAIILENDKMEV